MADPTPPPISITPSTTATRSTLPSFSSDGHARSSSTSNRLIRRPGQQSLASSSSPPPPAPSLSASSSSLSSQERFSEETFDEISDTGTTSSSVPSALDVEVTPADLDHVDWQGIPWQSQAVVTRADYRLSRNAEYEMLRADQLEGTRPNNLASENHDLISPITHPDAPFFTFNYNNRMETNTVHHFQLRHLVAVPTPSHVIYSILNRVRCWTPGGSNESHICLNVGALGFAFARSSCVAAVAMPNDCNSSSVLVMAGGFGGEVAIGRYLESGKECEILFNRTVAHRYFSRDGVEVDSITNHLSPSKDAQQLIISSNDACLRRMDLERLEIVDIVHLGYPINASCQLDGRLIATVGDSREVALLDLRIRHPLIATMTGHTDYCFGVAWDGDSLLCSASQDRTARLFDLRLKPSSHSKQCVAALPAILSPIRSCHFGPEYSTRHTLVLAESDDYVHIYDTRRLDQRQTLDFFGEISGVSLDQSAKNIDEEALYVAIGGLDGTGGMLEFKRTPTNGISPSLTSLYLDQHYKLKKDSDEGQVAGTAEPKHDR